MKTTPVQPRPIEVRAVHLWRSTDRAPLGYFPGIFSTVGNSPNISLITSAFVGIDPFDALDAKLYPTPEACMAAWQESAVAEIKLGTMAAIGLGAELIALINAQGLFRDPALRVTTENPWEEELVGVGGDE